MLSGSLSTHIQQFASKWFGARENGQVNCVWREIGQKLWFIFSARWIWYGSKFPTNKWFSDAKYGTKFSELDSANMTTHKSSGNVSINRIRTKLFRHSFFSLHFSYSSPLCIIIIFMVGSVSFFEISKAIKCLMHKLISLAVRNSRLECATCIDTRHVLYRLVLHFRFNSLLAESCVRQVR